MSLFQCDYCGCMENSALTKCSYRQTEFFLEDTAPIKKAKEKFGLKKDEPFEDYCSACCPLGNGKWHGEFDRIYLPKGNFETAPNGNLRHKKNLDEAIEKFAIKVERV